MGVWNKGTSQRACFPGDTGFFDLLIFLHLRKCDFFDFPTNTTPPRHPI